MLCPFCQSAHSRVLESRPALDSPSIRRRRECIDCKQRWATQERYEVIDLTVLKRDGRHEPFDRRKLTQAIALVCQKTGVTRGQVENLVDDLEGIFQERREISADAIAEAVLQRLRLLNEVAFIRFASQYRPFASARDFIQSLQS